MHQLDVVIWLGVYGPREKNKLFFSPSMGDNKDDNTF